jgi:PIN domain nuclease of toxin-antitoxin system
VAAVIYLDTHVAAWLYAGLPDRFPTIVRDALNNNPLAISPMVSLELQYLFEIGRTSEPAETVVEVLQSQLEVTVCRKDFASIVAVARTMAWTRDPFDRLIVAHAALDQSRLVTKDAVVHQHYSLALWG